MELSRAPSATHLMLAVAACAFAIFLFVCSLYGWYVGGRPPGWFEGKALVGPMYIWGGLCAFPAVIVAIGGLIDILRSGLGGICALRVIDWASLVGALAVCAVLVGHVLYPWGLGLVYAIAGWRQGIWMPEQADNPIFAL